MYAMQYEMALPADYDMEIIRERVRARGALLDAFPGPGLRSYCVRERGIDGSSLNQYAPVVRHWTGVAFMFGPSVQQSAALWI